MVDFTIPEGKNTPRVHFQSKLNTLLVSGKSYPENASKFYDEIGLNLKNHFYAKEFFIEFDFDYISSSSVICILELLKKMLNFAPATSFYVKFIYENGDDDMLAIGENYQKVTGFTFEFIAR